MRIEHWSHEKVLPNGDCLNQFGEILGKVETSQSITFSPEEGGCGKDQCRCSEGHWISINFGRNEKKQSVSGVTVFFDNWGEMQLLFSCRKISV